MTEINDNADGYQRGLYEKQLGTTLYLQGDKEVALEMIEASESEFIEPSEDALFATLPAYPEMEEKFYAAYETEESLLSNSTEEIIALADANITENAALIQSKLADITNNNEQIETTLAEFLELTDTNVNNAMTESQNYANQSTLINGAVFALAAAASIICALVIGSRIINPLKKLSNIAEKVSMGDLNQTVDVQTKDEINDLAASFQRMINAFKVTEALSKENEA